MGMLLFFVGMLFVLTGCFALPVEDPVLPAPIVQIQQAQAMRTSVVMRGDVVRYTNTMASYVPAREERLSFDIEGLRILGIYVDTGDYVEAGDVIASLYWPEIQAQYEAAVRREEWLLLNLSHLERRQQHARNQGETTAESNARFQAERTRIRQELDILAMELDYFARENERRYLRAGMNGTVSRVLFFTEGMVSSRTAIVATIVDQTYSIFAVRVVEERPMNIGEYFILTVNRVAHRAVVIDPYKFGVQRESGIWNEVYLTFADESPIMDARTAATVHIVLEEVNDVLFVPLQAVYHASERVFVYVLNEAGVRVLRDVEVGLRGNTAYEIISGLEEGELVVIG